MHWRCRAVAVMVLLSCAMLRSDPKPAGFSVHDKAHYLAPAVINFVRPGLAVKIISASVSADGTMQADFKITDLQGLPLDRTGMNTPGAVSLNFIAAYIPQGATQYTAYTTRIETSPTTGATAVQATSESNGVYQQVADGEYVYNFVTKAPAGFDATATHAIGVYASRDLSQFDLGTQYSNDVFNFVPNGSPVTTVHDIIRTQTCNKCHDPLAAHGGARRDVRLCVLCHTAQTSDAETGNTVDFPVMIHKIHMGADLPSVQAGTPYQIVGFMQQVSDFSTVVFPAEDPRNCRFCHEPGPAQANAWLERPSRKACGSCHDNVNFATGENHVNLPQLSDNLCSTCHIPQGDQEFDASIMGAHTLPRFSNQLPGVVFTLLRVDNGAAGMRPTVTFTLNDKSGNPLQPSDLNSLSLVLAGPTTDYASSFSESARQAQGANGNYTYTFQRAIPLDATGTYTVGIEGYRNITLNPGTTKAITVRDAGVNQILNFSVDGSAVKPRRSVVQVGNCNACHYSLTAHGNLRNQTSYCVLCHNPNATDQPQRPAPEMPPQSIDFRTMVHKIHTGENLESEYTVYGFGMMPTDFKEVRFPGDRRDCLKCHVDESEELPLPPGLLPVVNPRGLINPEGPITAACLGCHTDRPSASHALAMTTSLGESCEVCHGPDADFATDKVHAR